jgi:small subunit ribosomal protein S6
VSNYELVYIINPNITEEAMPEVINKISDLVKKNGGNVAEVIPWGKKKFSYPVKKFNEGNYILAKIDVEPGSLKKIDASLKMDENILRHLMIKAND